MPQFLATIFLDQWESFKEQCILTIIFAVFTVTEAFNQVVMTYH